MASSAQVTTRRAPCARQAARRAPRARRPCARGRCRTGPRRPAAPSPRRPTAGPGAAERPQRRSPLGAGGRGFGGGAAAFAASFLNSNAMRTRAWRLRLMLMTTATMRAGSSAAPFRMASSGAVLSAFFRAGVGLGWDFRLGLQRWLHGAAAQGSCSVQKGCLLLTLRDSGMPESRRRSLQKGCLGYY